MAYLACLGRRMAPVALTLAHRRTGRRKPLHSPGLAAYLPLHTTAHRLYFCLSYLYNLHISTCCLSVSYALRQPAAPTSYLLASRRATVHYLASPPSTHWIPPLLSCTSFYLVLYIKTSISSFPGSKHIYAFVKISLYFAWLTASLFTR